MKKHILVGDAEIGKKYYAEFKTGGCGEHSVEGILKEKTPRSDGWGWGIIIGDTYLADYPGYGWIEIYEIEEK